MEAWKWLVQGMLYAAAFVVGVSLVIGVGLACFSILAFIF